VYDLCVPENFPPGAALDWPKLDGRSFRFTGRGCQAILTSLQHPKQSSIVTTVPFVSCLSWLSFREIFLQPILTHPTTHVLCQGIWFARTVKVGGKTKQIDGKLAEGVAFESAW